MAVTHDGDRPRLKTPLAFRRAHAHVVNPVAAGETVAERIGQQHVSRPTARLPGVEAAPQAVNVAPPVIAVDERGGLSAQQQQVQIDRAGRGGGCVDLAEKFADRLVRERGAVGRFGLPALPGEIFASIVQVPAGAPSSCSRPAGR